VRETFFTLLLVIFELGAAKCQSKTLLNLEDSPALAITFSAVGGFYSSPIQIDLKSPDAVIYFTTDGSRPTEKSTVFNTSIVVQKSTVVRAFTKKNGERSQIFTQSYFINEPRTAFPVVSISITPSILFDQTTGLFQEGPGVDYNEEGRFGANFWSRKEVTCNAEIFETDGRCVHNSLTGFRLFGGFSRVFPQKSMVLSFRKEYGKKFLKHRIFGDEGGKKFKYLVLRNGGSDWGKAQMRDALTDKLTADWGLEQQAYRPAQVYINGKYWGMYDLREKINARFLADHSDADRDSIDLLEHRQTVRRGTIRQYSKMLAFIDNHDLSNLQNFNEVRKLMDIENFMDYQIAQIFCDNTDAGGNIRYWRPHRSGGKWRWILFDTDFGWGLNNHEAWQHDALDFFTEPNGPDWPNPAWSTFLLRNLLKNKTFEAAFINRFCDRMNTSFSTEKVLSTVADFEKMLAPELPRQWARWQIDPATWRRHLGIIRTFAEKRPSAMLGFLQKKCPTAGNPVEVRLDISEGGQVVINDCVQIKTCFFRGKYFENIPIRIKAVANYGYRFMGWAGVEKRKELTIQPGKLAGRTMRAVFEKYEHSLANKVFFNEIVANNRQTGDWIELLNSSNESINLKNWIITDGKNEFTFPEKIMPAGSFLIVCEHVDLFQKTFPNVRNVVGDLNFGLDKVEEKLLLFAADGGSIDSAFYRVVPLDEFCSIDLLLPNLDNGDSDNWRQRLGIGSPNEANPYFLATIAAEKKELWLRVGIAAALILLGAISIGWRRRKTFA
jgi:hypothetical protein